MAKAQYIGVGGIARKVSGEYVGVSGIARKVKSGYIGVSGVARQFFLGEFTWKKYTVRYENTSTVETYKTIPLVESDKWDFYLSMNRPNVWYGSEASYGRWRGYNETGYCDDTVCMCVSASAMSSNRNSRYANTRYGYNYTSTTYCVFVPGVIDAKVTRTIDTETGTYRNRVDLTCEELMQGTLHMRPGETTSYSENGMFTSCAILGPTAVDIRRLKPVGSINQYVSDVTSENENAYPENGIHTDGYWYVKQ